MGRLSKAWLWAIPQFVGFVVLLCWVDSASRPVIALFLAVFLMILSVSIFIYRWTLPQVLPASYYRPRAIVSATDLREGVPHNAAPTFVTPAGADVAPPPSPEPASASAPIPETKHNETNPPTEAPAPVVTIVVVPLTPEPPSESDPIPETEHGQTSLAPVPTPAVAPVDGETGTAGKSSLPFEVPPTPEPASATDVIPEMEQAETNLPPAAPPPIAEVAMPPEPPRAADPVPEMEQAETNLAPEPPSPAAPVDTELGTAWKSSLSFAVTPALASPVPEVPLPAEPASTPGPVGETEDSETNQIPLPLLPAPKPTAARRPRAHANNHRPISKARRVKRPTPARSHPPTRVKAAPPRPRQPASTTANPPNPKPRRRLKSRFLTQASRLKLNLRSKRIPSLKLSPQRGELVFPFSPIHGI